MSITVYYKGLYFFLYFCHLFAIISMFIVQVFTVTVQFHWIQSSASVFTDSLSSSIISITTGFLLLSHLFYTCSVQVLNHTQIIAAFGYLYNFPPYNAIYLFSQHQFTSINLRISLHRHFSTIIFSIWHHFI